MQNRNMIARNFYTSASSDDVSRMGNTDFPPLMGNDKMFSKPFVTT